MIAASTMMWYVLAAIALYGVTLAVSLLFVGVLLVRLPATYFQDSADRHWWVDHHPVARMLLHVLKNVAGLGVIALGLLLSLPGIPGQGLLTVLIGLMLVDFPGKRRLERRLVGQPRVFRAVNRLRQRYGKPPLVLERAPREPAPP